MFDKRILMLVLELRIHVISIADSMPSIGHRQNNKTYFVSEITATWYDARKYCLGLGGDLASIMDFREMGDWSWLSEHRSYWIGLNRNKWIWNSTGDI